MAREADASAPEQTLVATKRGVPAVRSSRSIPERLGRYRVLDILGQGGMGVVYTAYDPELDRKVAIKLLRSTASTSAVARLQREAQAMAKLSHPNVVPVFDVGRVDGQVFIAMDHVVGEDLRVWLDADEHLQRDWRETLAVFLAAGRGLAYAHANGIVHRDFKPDNVLVSGAGPSRRVQVLDFGLAKGLAPGPSGVHSTLPAGSRGPADRAATGLEDETIPAHDLDSVLDVGLGATGAESPTGTHTSKLGVALTRAGSVMGTPAYMSPEQHHGRDAGPASDQFSFCVALFEGLWGRRPFAGDTLATIAFSVVRGELTPPPSQAKVPARLWPILQRGLQIEPDDRWPSMNALLEALADDPNEGRRARVVGVLALGMVVGAVAWGASRGPEPVEVPPPVCQALEAPLGEVWGPEQRALLAARYAASQEGWAGPIHDALERQLDGWAARWIADRTETCEATQLRAEQSPALMDLRMACYARKLGELDATVQLLTVSDDPPLAKGVELAAGLPALEACADAAALRAVTPPPDPATAEVVAEVHERLAEARSKSRAGQPKPALEIVESMAQAVEAARYRPLQAEYDYRRGSLLIETGSHDEGKALIEQAMSEALAVRDDDLAGRACEELVFTIGYTDGDYDGGMRWARLGQALLDRSEAPSKRRQLELASKRGMVEFAANHFDKARALIERAIELRVALDGADHPGLADSLDTLGAIHLRRGEYEDAEEYFERTLAIVEAAYGADHVKVAFPLNNLALVHERLAEFDQAAASFARVVAILSESQGETHPNVGLSRNNLGGVLTLAGRHDEAAVELTAALEILEGSLGAEHQLVARALNMRADLEIATGEFEAAVVSATRAKQIRIATVGPDHPDLGVTLMSLGRALLALGRGEAAVQELRRAVALLDHEDADPIDRGLARFALARALDSVGASERADALVEAAREDLRAGEVRAQVDLDALEAWAAGRAR